MKQFKQIFNAILLFCTLSQKKLRNWGQRNWGQIKIKY